jgi:hypothetical protein
MMRMMKLVVLEVEATSDSLQFVLVTIISSSMYFLYWHLKFI